MTGNLDVETQRSGLQVFPKKNKIPPKKTPREVAKIVIFETTFARFWKSLRFGNISEGFFD